MSKKIKPLEALNELRFEGLTEEHRNKCCNIIENELKYCEMEHTLRIMFENANYELVREKQENKKKLKALEIIKAKKINVFIFFHSGGVEIYNDMVEQNRKLTQEEFDLLKEVLL